MTLADAKPIERKLMAAMAQLDCGQCGYLCQTYAEAVWSGAEADKGRCVPGGKDTQRKLKELLSALEPQRGGALDVGAGITRGGVKPSHERGGRSNGGGLLRENDEDGLRRVLGQMGLRDLAAAGGIHERDVAVHQLGERPLTARGDVFS